MGAEDFINAVFDELVLANRLLDREVNNIPSSGRVVIVANQPMGGVDALALLKLVFSVRPDVKIVVNDRLADIPPLSRVILPVGPGPDRKHRQQIADIENALRKEHAVIVFPADYVSRRIFNRVLDRVWHRTFLHFALKTRSPVLPVFIGGRNSWLFYLLSWMNKRMSTGLLPREFLKKRKSLIDIRVGGVVPVEHLSSLSISQFQIIKLLRRDVYRLGKGKKQVFKTEKTVTPPQSRQSLKKELQNARMLGETQDGKKILLMEGDTGSPVLAEIGRLREIAFRQVGEGTGNRNDLDAFDLDYRHLVLWDEGDLEIAGAYRIAECWKWVRDSKAEGAFEFESITARLYSASLFDYGQGFQPFFSDGIELGRSFVQPQYWGRRSLDYLWQGLGAYVANNPQIRFVFGPVSISASYPKIARDMLVWFYGHYYPGDKSLAVSVNPFEFQPDFNPLKIFRGDDVEADFETLRSRLEFLGLSIPTLLKQYVDVCHAEGVNFVDFNIDPGFSDCVDAMLINDLDFLKDKKRKRYVDRVIERKNEA